MREFEKTFGTGRPLRYALEDYWHAVAGDGELGFQWQDKPHRLVYDLLDGMLDARAEITRLCDELEQEKRINADYFRRQELMVKDADALRAEKAEARVRVLEKALDSIADERTGVWLEGEKLIEGETVQFLRELARRAIEEAGL